MESYGEIRRVPVNLFGNYSYAFVLVIRYRPIKNGGKQRGYDWGALHSLNTYLDGKIWPLEELLEREV